MMIEDCRLQIEELRIINPEELRRRTKEFALRIIKLVEALPRSRTANIISKQLLRCGTSVGANYKESKNQLKNKCCHLS